MPNEDSTPTAGARVTIIKPPANAGKRFVLLDGKAVGQGANTLGSGAFVRLEFEDIGEAVAIMEAVDPGSYAVWGGMPAEGGLIVPSGAAKADGQYSRTLEFVTRDPDAPAVVPLDYDPAPGSKAMGRKEYLAWLRSTGIRSDIAIRESTSSLLYNSKTGAVLRPSRGLRALIMVERGSDVEAVLRRLFEHSWLSGHGRILISGNGIMHDKAAVDMAMRTVTQPDFVPGGAICGPGLEQRRPPWEIDAGNTRMTSADLLPEFTPAELKTIRIAKRAARLRNNARAKEIAAAWKATRAEEAVAALVEKRGMTLEAARAEVEESRFVEKIMAARSGGMLDPSFVVTVDMPPKTKVTLREIAADPKRFAGKRILDPVEPTYSSSTTGTILLRGGRITLSSFAHGETTYWTIGPDLSRWRG